MWSIQLALTLDLVSVTNRRLSAASLGTPVERPGRSRREGVETGERVHMSSSVHTGNGFMGGRNPIVENSDYFTQLNQIRNYFHDSNPESTSPCDAPPKQSSFGEPLSRVPSVSIFRPLPHFPAVELPEDHLASHDRPPLPRGGFSPDGMQCGKPFARVSPDGARAAAGGISFGPTSSYGGDGLVSASSSLGRSSAIPIMSGQPTPPPEISKIAGSFRDVDNQDFPIMSMRSDVRMPVNPIAWSPAKPARPSPPMSPYRSRENSDEGYEFEVF